MLCLFCTLSSVFSVKWLSRILDSKFLRENFTPQRGVAAFGNAPSRVWFAAEFQTPLGFGRLWKPPAPCSANRPDCHNPLKGIVNLLADFKPPLGGLGYHKSISLSRGFKKIPYGNFLKSYPLTERNTLVVLSGCKAEDGTASLTDKSSNRQQVLDWKRLTAYHKRSYKLISSV